MLKFNDLAPAYYCGVSEMADKPTFPLISWCITRLYLFTNWIRHSAMNELQVIVRVATVHLGRDGGSAGFLLVVCCAYCTEAQTTRQLEQHTLKRTCVRVRYRECLDTVQENIKAASEALWKGMHSNDSSSCHVCMSLCFRFGVFWFSDTCKDKLWFLLVIIRSVKSFQSSVCPDPSALWKRFNCLWSDEVKSTKHIFLWVL